MNFPPQKKRSTIRKCFGGVPSDARDCPSLKQNYLFGDICLILSKGVLGHNLQQSTQVAGDDGILQ